MPDYGLPEYYDFANKRGVTASNIAGFDIETIQALCTTRRIDSEGLLDYGNMEELDDAGTTYCTEPVEVKAEGLWNFLCTRNNNFSNRSQKGSLLSSDSASENYAINSNGYSSFDDSPQAGNAQIVIQSGMIDDSDTLLISVTTWRNTGEESTIVEITGYDGGEFSADTLSDDGFIELWIPYTPKSLHTPYVNHRTDESENWKFHSDAAMDYDEGIDTYFAVINITEGGYYIAVNDLDWGMLVVFGLFVLGFVGLSGYLIAQKCKQ